MIIILLSTYLDPFGYNIHNVPILKNSQSLKKNKIIIGTDRCTQIIEFKAFINIIIVIIRNKLFIGSFFETLPRLKKKKNSYDF